MEFNFFTFIFLFAILTSVLALLYLNFRQDKAIDNSFDANARRIKIDIETSPEGGKMYIRILDDGSGMSMNELKDALWDLLNS